MALEEAPVPVDVHTPERTEKKKRSQGEGSLPPAEGGEINRHVEVVKTETSETKKKKKKHRLSEESVATVTEKHNNTETDALVSMETHNTGMEVKKKKKKKDGSLAESQEGKSAEKKKKEERRKRGGSEKEREKKNRRMMTGRGRTKKRLERGVKDTDE